MTRLAREIAILKDFPKQFVVGQETLVLTAFPRLLLALEMTPRTDQAYGVLHEYDIVCEVSALRASNKPLKINVQIATSRQWPAAEAMIIEGNKADAEGLNLDTFDNVVCQNIPNEVLWKTYGSSIRELIQRWVTEHSLRSISNLSDFEIASALRSQSPDFYNEILTYVSTIDVTNPEIIRSYMRTALVQPKVIREKMLANPATIRVHSAEEQELMNQTIELSSRHQAVKSSHAPNKLRA